MRRPRVWMACAVVALGLFGCSGSDEDDDAKETCETYMYVGREERDRCAPMGGIRHNGDLEMRLEESPVSQGSDACFDLQVTNEGDEVYSLDHWTWTLGDPGSADRIEGVIDVQYQPGEINVMPGQQASATVCFPGGAEIERPLVTAAPSARSDRQVWVADL
jgi:hypothetical protein